MADTRSNRRQFLGAVSVSLLSGVGDRSGDRGRTDETNGQQRRSELYVGAVYIPFLGDRWSDCIDHLPEVGQYDVDDDEVIDETRTDHPEFARNGWQDYHADLRTTTITSTTTTPSRTTTRDTTPTRTTVAESPTARTTTSERAMADGESTRETETTAVDTPGFGLLTGLAALALGASRYLRGDADE